MKTLSIKKLIYIVLFCMTSQPVFTQVNVKDSLALIDLYNKCGGEIWKNSLYGWGWGDVAVKDWSNLTVENDRVVTLNFSGTLTGSLPFSIGDLTELRGLSLNLNDLTGPIPSSIGNLTKLTTLILSNNHLDGQIPSTIGNLTQLGSLYLSGNKLSGAIPSTIGNLGNLQYLNIYDNQLSDTIPSEIGNLLKLRYLSFDNNKLSGSIPPSIGNLTSLVTLGLSYNQLTGIIPSTIGNLSNLSLLVLHFNNLSGRIPSTITNLSNLTDLLLNNNNLIGPFPSSLFAFTNFTKLTNFTIYRNDFLFDGMDSLKMRFPSIMLSQNYLPLTNINDTMYVSAGGKLSDNSYQWARDGNTVKNQIGDSSLAAIKSSNYGSYSVVITNALLPGAGLRSTSIRILENCSSVDSIKLYYQIGSVSVHQWQENSGAGFRIFQIISISKEPNRLF